MMAQTHKDVGTPSTVKNESQVTVMRSRESAGAPLSVSGSTPTPKAGGDHKLISALANARIPAQTMVGVRNVALSIPWRALRTGVAKGRIVFWQVIAIALWGVVFAGFATAGINFIGVAEPGSILGSRG